MKSYKDSPSVLSVQGILPNSIYDAPMIFQINGVFLVIALPMV